MNNTLKTIAEQIAYGDEFKFKFNLNPGAQYHSRVYEEINGPTNVIISYINEEPVEILLTNIHSKRVSCYDCET